MDDRAEYCLRLQSEMESNRSIFESHWREVAELVRPNSNTFQQLRPEGDKRTQRLFDATAMLALPKFAAATIAFTMPAHQQWHKLTAMDDALVENKNVKMYLEAVNNRLFKARYAPDANFISQSGESVLEIGAFGTGYLFIDDVLGVGIRYKAIPVAEGYIAVDEHGRVNRFHRKFQLTAYQAVSKFGLNAVSQAVKNAYEKHPLTKFWFLHCVGPNDEFDQRLVLHPVKGKRFQSYYLEQETRKTVDEGGYRTFPYVAPRFETAAGENYGRGPAMNVLPAIKTLNEMKKTVIRAGQMVVAPPIMLTEDASLQAFNLRPNALNYGYVGSNGQALAQPFETKGRVDIGRDLMNDEREAINDAFFVTLFRILVEEPQITATEAMLRAQEKGQLLSQPMGRTQSEMAGPMVDREIDILAAAGVLPPMPRELMDAGGQYKIKYEAPLNQAQKAGAGVAIMQSVQAIAPLAQVDPSVMLIVDTDKAARMLFDVNGVPASILRSDEDVTALKDAQAKQAAAQQMLAAAPVAASAAKDLASAQSMAASSPNQAAPNLFPV